MSTEERTAKPRRRSLRILLLLLAAAVAVGLASGAGVYKVRRHVTGSAAFCTECHTDTANHLRGKVHGELACGACHSAELGAGLRQWIAAKTQGPAANKPHGQSLPERCIECHAGEERDRKIFAELGGHADHVLRAGQACSECHGDATHVESVRPSSCTDCHESVEIHPSPLDGASCTSCHAFAGRGRTSMTLEHPDCARCHHEPTTTVAFVSTHSASVTPTMVHGDLGACGLCHNPHDEAPTSRTGGLDCARCHAAVARKRAAAPDFEQHSDCATCHAPHGERAELEDICAGCHTERSASTLPASMAARHGGCADCHRDHRFTVDRARCVGCHKKEPAKLAEWKAEKHQDCLVCHAPHVETPLFDACKTCHAKNLGHQHQDCSTCHQPHESAKVTPTCASCHAPVVKTLRASTASKDGGHQGCMDCHAPHATGGATGRCSACHREEASLALTAPADKHRNCSSCHQPHTFGTQAAVCSTCHSTATLGKHNKDCASCHQTHGPSAPPSVNCQGCHQGVNPSRGEHATCTSCHDVHVSKSGGPACASCHTGPAAGAASWPNAKHKDCAGCHEKHEAATPRTCATCHASQAASLGTGGKHRCSTCHDVHQPVQTWANGCAKCHAGQAAGVAARGPKHSNCASCHQPHQSKKAPGCTSCHSSLPGLHATREHGQCSSCHSPHAVRFPDRAACVKCHDDMPEHFPTARVCTSCHSFD